LDANLIAHFIFYRRSLRRPGVSVAITP